jgi:hypothetical protein
VIATHQPTGMQFYHIEICFVTEKEFLSKAISFKIIRILNPTEEDRWLELINVIDSFPKDIENRNIVDLTEFRCSCPIIVARNTILL